jgi:hypothetical protein
VSPIEVATFDFDDDPRWRRPLRVYRAEDKAAANHPAAPLDGTVDAAQVYVDRITGSAWWRDRCELVTRPGGTARLPVIGVDVLPGRNGGGYALWRLRRVHPNPRIGQPGGLVAQIRLGRGLVHGCPAIADPWVILHELAHVLALAAGHRGHGSPFVHYYLAIVRRYLGPESAAALRAACLDEGIRPRRPRLPANRLSTG